MKKIDNISGLQSELLLKTGFSLGLVPTMGALHKGHLELVKKSVLENDISIVSIFVNPKQFNDPEDLKKYPRNLEEDLSKLEQTGCDYVFTPSVEEMYAGHEDEYFDFGHLEEVMEGKYRPGHFNGVAQVVSRLFRIVNPNKAYFGLKDFQQVAVIKKMAEILDFHIDIVSCPTVREADGLAMSSRNVLLSQEERISAAKISQTIFKAKELKVSKTVEEIREWVINSLNSTPHLSVEYFDIVNADDLRSAENWETATDKVGCIAVKAGKTRLIDNVTF